MEKTQLHLSNGSTIFADELPYCVRKDGSKLVCRIENCNIRHQCRFFNKDVKESIWGNGDMRL